jgi:signal transduction histidine kinase
LLLLLFPTGRLPSPRWRPVLWIGTVGIVLVTVGTAVNPVRFSASESANVTFQNPFGIDAYARLISTIILVGAILVLPAGVLCIASLVVRYRNSLSEDRERIKWLAYVAVADAVLLLVGEVVSSIVGCEVRCGNDVFGAFFLILSLGVPAAVGAAILRHGLYDIDVIINKTVLYGLLAGFFTLVYAAIVVGIGTVVGNRSNALLTMVAAVVAAIAFQPARQRAARLANRLVYGKRSSPYEVLSEFSSHMAEAYSVEDVLPRMARVLAEGAGARRAGVWLALGGDLRPAAVWPADDAPGETAVKLVGKDLPALDADLAVPVRHQGDLLGALTVAMPADEPATEATGKLLADLAGQAGLVLRNVALIEELRASRTRLVTAQDEERRRLERNIHDGAQQQLVALKLRLGLAESLAEKDPAATRKALGELAMQTQEALEDLRDLARGIYPPLLADQGLAAALGAQAKRSAIDVVVEPDGIGRYSQAAEAATYFCCLEALQNVAKYAGASQATVRLWQEDGILAFSVRDDGRGFDPASTGYGTGLQGMADRLSALGGSLEVESAVGTGTVVTGRIPVT